MTMKEELAALKKKRDAGDITAFKFRQGERRIKKKYGVDAPSNVTKIFRALTTPSPKSVKGKAATKAEKVEKAQKELAAKSKAAGGKAVLSRKRADSIAKADTKIDTKKRAAPKFNPSGLKVSAKKKAKAAPKKEKMYTAINMKTGKADFDVPKVTAAQRLKQEDKYKALSSIKKAATSSMAKKGKK